VNMALHVCALYVDMVQTLPAIMQGNSIVHELNLVTNSVHLPSTVGVTSCTHATLADSLSRGPMHTATT
jgi:hypothetical protein